MPSPAGTLNPLDPGRRSVLGALVWLTLAGAGIALIAAASPLRSRGVALVERAGLATAPGVRETVFVIPSPEDAAAFAAESVLERLAPASAPPGEPQGVGPDTPALLSGAQALAADGLEGAPGGVQHLVLLGRGAYASWELSREPRPGASRAWERTLSVASASAPGFAVASGALAAAYLGAWPRLSTEERERARPAIAAGFRDPAFVRRALPSAVDALGAERAAALLPNRRASLEAAASVLRAMGQTAAAEQASRAALAAPSSGSSAPDPP
jgi:hypothetical protein